MSEPMSDERLAEIREQGKRTVDRARDDLLAEIERLKQEIWSVRADLLAAARISWDRDLGMGGDLQEKLHSALGIDYEASPYEVAE